MSAKTKSIAPFDMSKTLAIKIVVGVLLVVGFTVDKGGTVDTLANANAGDADTSVLARSSDLSGETDNRLAIATVQRPDAETAMTAEEAELQVWLGESDPQPQTQAPPSPSPRAAPRRSTPEVGALSHNRLNLEETNPRARQRRL